MLHHSSLGVGNWFIPDINTKPAPSIFSSQVDSIILSSPLLSQHGEVPPGFQFAGPPKRGRPRGSKTKKLSEKSKNGALEYEQLKLMTGKSRKRDATLLAVDPIESAESSYMRK